MGDFLSADHDPRQVLMQFNHPQSRLSSDVRCPICGQGFLIFAELANHARQIDSRRMIQQALINQHSQPRVAATPHPDRTFNIPGDSEAASFSASSSLSDLLDGAL